MARNDLTQTDERANLAHAGQVEQLLRVQLVEALIVARPDQHEIVEFTGDHMALHAAGDSLCRRFEIRERGRGRAIEYHADQYDHPGIQPVGVEMGHDAIDQSVLLESVDASRTGRGAQIDRFRQCHIRDRGISLQFAENGLVDTVEILGGQGCHVKTVRCFISRSGCSA